MNQGILILFLLLLNASAMINETGMIHSALSNFTVVAICRACAPNL